MTTSTFAKSDDKNMNRFSKGRFITIMGTFKEIKTAGMEALAWKYQLTREAYPRNYERGVK